MVDVGCVVCLLPCRFAGDEKRVGVATSRLACMMDNAITRLNKASIRGWLDREKMKAVDAEIRPLVPHFKAVARMV